MNNKSKSQSPPELHKGHRERLRKKFLEFGPEALTEHELLEMLLFYSIPRKNTNEIAHRLLNEFGSIEAVITAPHKLLMKIDGVSSSTVVFLSLLSHVYLHSFKGNKSARGVRKLDTLSATDAFFGEYLFSPDDERFGIALLDGSMKLIDFKIAPASAAAPEKLDFERIVRFALEGNAKNVIIAHNHPSGTPRPSAADLELTARVDAALSMFNINLVEHVIVCEDASYPTMRFRARSMRPSNENTLGEDFYNKFYNS